MEIRSVPGIRRSVTGIRPSFRFGRARSPAGVVVLAAFAFLGGCGDRERPTGLDPLAGVELSVALLAPENGSPRDVGSRVVVTVQASEVAGRLEGVGYEARFNSLERELIDSTQVAFAATADTVLSFDFLIPGDLPAQVQIDFFGVALGPAGERAVSPARSILTLD